MRAGFSLIEMTIAVAIVLVVTAAVFALVDPAQGAFHVQLEAIDMQQRLRVAVDAIKRDIIMAGAGTGKYFAAVLPGRRGQLSPDSPGAFHDDRISVLYVPAGALETTVRAATDATTAVYVNPQAGCPARDPLCGMAPNVMVVIFDETGAYDTFRVAAIQNDPPALIRAGGALSKSYAASATVAPIVSATYWLRQDAAAGTAELMKYDGYRSDLPLADRIVGLSFEYYGDPLPPERPKAPDIDEDDDATPTYGSGENCIFSVMEGARVVRPELSILAGAPYSLVRLDDRRLTDGPWCPDPSMPNRFDADLLRVRRIRVTLRVRASHTFLYARLPDQKITFDVTARNLSLP